MVSDKGRGVSFICKKLYIIAPFILGLQEYIEAVSFYHYLQTGELITVEQVQQGLIFTPTQVRNEQVRKYLLLFFILLNHALLYKMLFNHVRFAIFSVNSSFFQMHSRSYFDY